MAKTKGGLGRGLGALMPELTTVKEQEQEDGLRQVPIDDIVPNPSQPRQVFDEDDLADLTDSISAQGILSPLLVTERDGGLQLVSGERRLRAARRAGLDTVPVLVRVLTDDEVAQLALVENIQRANLSALEEARGYERLMQDFGHSAQAVADAVGKSRPHVANLVRLLMLPDAVIQLLEDDRISAGHARTLLRLEDPALQVEVAHDVAETSMSVRALEALVADILLNPLETEGPEKKTNPGTRGSAKKWRPVVEQLSESLQTNVRIRDNGKVGHLDIEFYGDDDLTRILDALKVTLH